MRVAVVHDWLYVLGGAEKVLQSILAVFPQADVFTMFDILGERERQQIGYTKATTSYIQHLPLLSRAHRAYVPLMTLAVEQFDFRSYDLVISSSSAVAKGILTGPDQLHVSYVHSPMRYAWDLQNQYLDKANLRHGLKSLMVRMLLGGLRIWDSRTASGVDKYIANSGFIARRIQKIYGRASTVIYPPVDVPAALAPAKKGDYFLTASRLVPYKNVGSIVEAFRALPDCKLVVVGTGPEQERVRKLAGPNVEMRGYVEDAELRSLMRGARAFVFAAEEDFGIVPVEAQSEGTPVIALGRGGSRETILVSPSPDGPPTGVFFDEPRPDLIAAAVSQFIAREGEFSREACYANACHFATERFQQEFKLFVEQAYDAFRADRDARPTRRYRRLVRPAEAA